MQHLESQIQVQICKLLQLHKIYFHSCPNELAGGGKGAKIRMGQFISMGLRPGVADLVVFWPSGIGYVEVKTPTGRQSDNQKRFQERCESYGVPYDLVRSVEDVERLIRKYSCT